MIQTSILSSKLCGPFNRFELTSMQTRFGSVEWFLADALVTDEATGLPAIVRQGTEAECLALVGAADAEQDAREAGEE